MSKSGKRARWEAEAQAKADTAPSAPSAEVVAGEALSEPELVPEAPLPLSAELPAEATETQADLEPEAPAEIALPSPVTNFAPDGTRHSDQVDAADSVRCEVLANIIWRGVTAPVGTVLMVPHGVADRLVRKQLVKRL
jgi:hypothetical protein